MTRAARGASEDDDDDNDDCVDGTAITEGCIYMYEMPSVTRVRNTEVRLGV